MKEFFIGISIILSSLGVLAQGTFNVTYDNEFLATGEAVGLSVFHINNKVYTLGFMPDSDEEGIGVLLEYSDDGILLNSYEIDSPVDSFNVNVGRYSSSEFDFASQEFIIPFLEAHNTDSTVFWKNSVLRIDLNGEMDFIPHVNIDEYKYNFYQLRKYDDGYVACGYSNFDDRIYVNPTFAHGFLMRLDSQGNQMWVQRYEEAFEIAYMDINDEGEFILGGFDWPIAQQADEGDALIIKTDNFGNELWRF